MLISCFPWKSKPAFSSCWILQNPVTPQVIRLLDPCWNGEGKEEWIYSLKRCITHVPPYWPVGVRDVNSGSKWKVSSGRPTAGLKGGLISFLYSFYKEKNRSQSTIICTSSAPADRLPALFRVSSLSSVPSLQDWQKRTMYSKFWLLLDWSA